MLELRAVSKCYAARSIVRDVSAHIGAGGALAVLGPSGSGKTTLLRLVAGLERVDSGEVWISGRCASSRTIHEPPKTRNIGMVFQDFALWPHMHAEKHLEFVLRGRGLSKSERIARSHEMLSWLGLQPLLRAYPGTMSGGEQQRLALARAFVTRPRILLLDEPFSNLNAAWRDVIVEELLRRMREEKTAIIIATHDPSDAAQLNATVLQFS